MSQFGVSLALIRSSPSPLWHQYPPPDDWFSIDQLELSNVGIHGIDISNPPTDPSFMSESFIVYTPYAPFPDQWTDFSVTDHTSSLQTQSPSTTGSSSFRHSTKSTNGSPQPSFGSKTPTQLSLPQFDPVPPNLVNVIDVCFEELTQETQPEPHRTHKKY
ncbi:hypothetical protein EJ02DRAFT_477340 [Clathrospora elynae]|uniref:Uncharacterized protein n=1 Tax=Clathrospora elynae TaxID=706981 RepID=A0A6A5SYZ1_9PLEO|nr:hypothetical protein EJ02DRAFT_477340 [Clathrospora elynae]